MIESLSTRQRRSVALILLCCAVSFIWLAFVGPLFQFVRHHEEATEATLTSLSRDRAMIAQDAQIQAALTQLDNSTRWTRFYQSDKPEQAVLQLETDIRGIFQAPNNLTSMTAQPMEKKGPVTRLAVKVTLSITIDQLSEALGRLNSHARLLQIGNLAIQSPDFQPSDGNPTLSIQTEIMGFNLAPTGAPT